MTSILYLTALISCSQPGGTAEKAPRSGPIEVRSTSFPAAYLVDRVGGEGVAHTCILPPGESASEWHPGAEVVAGLAEADLIVANGAGYEAWIKTASLPDEKLVFTAQGIRLIEVEGQTHSHGKKGEHSHGETDPRTWTDPKAYLQQARNVKEALTQLDGGNRAYYHDRLAILEAELEALHLRLAAAAETLAGTSLVSSHPDFNYLARRYGLTLRSFAFEPGKPPSGLQLASFQAWSQDKDKVAILWNSKPSPTVASAFPKEVRHIHLDPLNQPGADDYDYLRQAGGNIERLKSIPSSGSDDSP
jgi:zinc transport system substrate-binding protein